MNEEIDLFMETEFDDLIIEAPTNTESEKTSEEEQTPSNDDNQGDNKTDDTSASQGDGQEQQVDNPTNTPNETPSGNEESDENSDYNTGSQQTSLASDEQIDDEKKLLKEKLKLSKYYTNIKRMLRLINYAENIVNRMDNLQQKIDIKDLRQDLLAWVYMINNKNMDEFDKWVKKEFSPSLKKILKSLPLNAKKLQSKLEASKESNLNKKKKV